MNRTTSRTTSHRDELMYVNVRYKLPNSHRTNKLLQQPVHDALSEPDGELGFALAAIR